MVSLFTSPRPIRAQFSVRLFFNSSLQLTRSYAISWSCFTTFVFYCVCCTADFVRNPVVMQLVFVFFGVFLRYCRKGDETFTNLPLGHLPLWICGVYSLSVSKCKFSPFYLLLAFYIQTWMKEPMLISLCCGIENMCSDLLKQEYMESQYIR